MSTTRHCHSLPFDTQASYSIAISNIPSEATGPIVTKFNVEPSGAEGTKHF